MKKRKDGRWVKVKKINGEPISFYSTAKTEIQAIKDIEKQMLSFKEKEEKGRLFSEVAEDWKTEHFELVENNTLKQYRPAYKNVFDEFKEKYIKDITALDINRYIIKYASQGYAQKTVKTRLLILNLIFKNAIVNGYIEYNPCQNVTIPKNLKKTKRAILTEIDKIKIESNTDKTFGILAYILLYTGLRRGEACALTYDDIDFTKNIITVNKTVEWVGNKPYIKPYPKTEAGKREIPLLDNIKPLLQRKKTGLVFSYNEKLIANSHFTRLWDKYKIESGINATPHQLRHAFATILYDAGIDIKSAQIIMGHANIQTTLDIYTHLSELRKTDTIQKLNDFVSHKVVKTNKIS